MFHSSHSIAAIVSHEYGVPCSYRKGEYEWQVKAEMKPEPRQALNARIEARINLLEMIRLILAQMDADIPLETAAGAPLAPVIFGWLGAGHSTQHLLRMLSTRLESAYWYVDHATGQLRNDNQANADLIEMLLDVLEARVEVAA